VGGLQAEPTGLLIDWQRPVAKSMLSVVAGLPSSQGATQWPAPSAWPPVGGLQTEPTGLLMNWQTPLTELSVVAELPSSHAGGVGAHSVDNWKLGSAVLIRCSKSQETAFEPFVPAAPSAPGMPWVPVAPLQT
jgi:hypothetical protein